MGVRTEHLSMAMAMDPTLSRKYVYPVAGGVAYDVLAQQTILHALWAAETTAPPSSSSAQKEV